MYLISLCQQWIKTLANDSLLDKFLIYNEFIWKKSTLNMAESRWNIGTNQKQFKMKSSGNGGSWSRVGVAPHSTSTPSHLKNITWLPTVSVIHQVKGLYINFPKILKISICLWNIAYQSYTILVSIPCYRSPYSR